jgi:hypothetical protein
MSLELLRFQTERLVEKQASVERLAAGYFARVEEKLEADRKRLREQDEALLAPYQAPTPPTRDEAGRFEAPASTDAQRFAANRAAMLAGLRATG